MKETKAEKSRRYLTEGRLRVFYVNATEIQAEVKGDSGGLYALGWQDGRWSCSCPARVDCSHLGALQLVTAVR